MQQHLKGRSAIVTGAGRGIGREIALLLAKQGAKVAVCDPGLGRGGEQTGERVADEVVELIRKDGGTALPLYDSVADYKKAGEMVYVSLPRLFAEARAKLDAGEKLPDDIRYLRGMTKLRYVFVYPDDKDLVIAGTAEPIDADFPGRPVEIGRAHV